MHQSVYTEHTLLTLMTAVISASRLSTHTHNMAVGRNGQTVD